MRNQSQLVDPNDAWAFLQDFPKHISARGEDYFRRGAVDQITVQAAGESYEAVVQGSEPYHVNVFYNKIGGWDAECTCPYDFDLCKHAYAAMRALLESPGGSTPTKPKKKTKKTAKKEPSTVSVLWAKFVAAKGKPLLKKEEKFLSAVSDLYREIVQGGQYPYFQRLQRILAGHFAHPWEPLQLWDKPPADDHEMWLYLVHFAREHRLQFPDFMNRVSDLQSFTEKIERMNRAREVSRWRDLFNSELLPEYSIEDAKTPHAKSEFRMRLEADGAFLELKEPPRPEFRRVSHTEFRNLGHRQDRGALQIDARSELLWGLLKHRIYSNHSLRLKYDDHEGCLILYRILDSPVMREMVITADDQPLQWSEDPLRWDVTSPNSKKDNSYRLKLVHQDGAPLASLDFALTGSPAYYVVHSTLYPGPPFDPAQLNPRDELELPVEAVEDRAGIAFLHRLGAPLPQKLARRVETVELHPRLSCQLKNEYQEQCVINIDAVGEDDEVHERWYNNRWTPPAKSPPAVSKNKVRILGRRQLACVPSIMDRLNPAQEWQGNFNVTTGKKFPDRFVEWLKGMPPQVEVRLSKELAALREPATQASVSLNVEETEIDWFDLSVAVEIEDTDLSPEEIKLLLAAKGDWVRLDNKGWRRIEFQLSEEDDEQLAKLGLNARTLNAEPQRLHALQLANPAAKKFLPEEQSIALTRRADEIQSRVTPEVPATIEADLRPYQIEGFHFLAYLSANHFGGILADDMGLGKTLQTLTWLMWLRAQEKKPGPSLVVCPKSVMDNWQAEAGRFAKGLRTRVWQRSEANHLPENTHMADLHVINYNQLRKLGESLHPVRFQAVILDEGQHIKNPSSQTAQAARGLKAEHRLVLTGTPIENRLLDLWSLMTFAMPGVLGSRSQFGKLYNAKDDPFARLRLSSRVRPFLIRRTKSQVAQDLPDRIEEDLYCEIEGEQKKLYQAERKRAQQILLGVKTQKQLNELRFNFLTSLLHLRQICCHPRLFHETTRAKSAKLEALLEQLEPIIAEGGKVLIFSQFVQLLELVELELESQGYTHWKLTGSTEDRGRLVEQFQNHDGPGVFLISLKAGGSGLNLTAASYVVLFDPWWNPAVENQAIDRTHRIGQTAKVIAYRLLIKNSIEEKIRELQKQKQALAADVLGEEKFSAALSLSDFQYLLSD